MQVLFALSVHVTVCLRDTAAEPTKAQLRGWGAWAASAKADSFTASWADALVRWDVFHFAQIARGGYQYEHQWAFFPGLPWLLHATALSEKEYLLGGALLVLFCDTTLVMYDLSLLVLGNRDAALLSAMLSLLPSSPATLRLVPYAEPFFTYLSYRG